MLESEQIKDQSTSEVIVNRENSLVYNCLLECIQMFYRSISVIEFLWSD